MGSLGNGDGDTLPFSKNAEDDFADTQVLDSQFSPSLSSGEGDRDEYELCYFKDTEPFDHTIPNDGTFETQLVDLCGETQPMNLSGNIQAMNLDRETQILEYPDCIGNMDTQLFDEFDNEVALDSDDEGTDKTENLNDKDDLSDVGVARWNNGQSDYQEKMHDSCLHKPNEEVAVEKNDVLIDKQHKSGRAMVFTSLRAESLRVSGLAAQKKALKLTNNYATENNGSPCVRGSPEVGTEVTQEHDKVNYNENGNGFSNEGKSRIAISAARKLFIDEQGNEFPYDGDIANEGEEFLHLPACNGDVAGLSYADSQEPGDLSQINALDVVDKFLKSNISEFDDLGIDLGNPRRGKLKLLSSAEGPRSLAKLAKDKSAVREKGVFDWDDNREDEGGGDIFRRKKEDFFDSRSHIRSFFRTRKAKSSMVNKQRDRLVHSDSKLMMHGANEIKKGAQVSGLNLQRNLVNEFDVQLNVNVSGQLETVDTDVPEIPNTGFDTQIAAEALCHGRNLANDACLGTANNLKVSPDGDCQENNVCLKQLSSRTKSCPSKVGVVTRQSKRRIGAEFCEEALIPLEKRSKNVRKQVDIARVTKRSKQAPSNRSGNLKKVQIEDSGQQNASALERSYSCDVGVGRTGLRSGVGLIKKRALQGKAITVPVAKRTRHSLARAQSISIDCENEKDLSKMEAHKEKRNTNTGMKGSILSKAKLRISLSGPNQSGESKNVKLTGHEQSDPKLTTETGISPVGLSYPKRRSLRNIPGQVNSYSLNDVLKPSAMQGDAGHSINGRKKSVCNSKFSIDFGTKWKTRSSSHLIGLLDQRLAETMTVKHTEKKIGDDSLSSQENAEATSRLYGSPREKSRPPDSASVTPTGCKTPVHDTSPVCMGNEYYRQVCKRTSPRSRLTREIRSLSSTDYEHTPVLEDLRKRRDMADVRVLYSHHLDGDIIKQQKKILARFGVSIASSVSDATHFIADKFVRTRNMLEAIASGKPVLTHLWIESCGQANSFIDEKSYILRDTKKEREIGFSMPVSLARANQCPLLQGQRVFITPNTKPGKEIMSSLVRAVNGQAVERIGRSTLKNDKVPDNLLVLSCEEDEALCVPFLEKGEAVYSSELILNGIVTQRLDYERHRLFADRVKKTRSTIWMKKDGNEFQPVPKQKQK